MAVAARRITERDYFVPGSFKSFFVFIALTDDIAIPISPED